MHEWKIILKSLAVNEMQHKLSLNLEAKIDIHEWK